jgi:hypothetical protein
MQMTLPAKTWDLLDETLGALSRPGPDVWTTMSRLARRDDAPSVLTDRYRETDSPALRWALVFVAANLDRPGVIPLLIEASVRTGPDEVDRSAARIACEALVGLADKGA